MLGFTAQPTQATDRPSPSPSPSTSPRARSSTPALTRAASPACGPVRRPCPRALLCRSLPLPTGPRMSAAHPSTVSSSSPTPQPPTRPAPDSGGRAGQGSRPGHGPVSLAPHPCNPCVAPTPPHVSHWMPLITPPPLASTARSPSAIGARSSAIKPWPSVALALSCAPPPPCGRPQHTLAKREEGGEEEGGEEIPKLLPGGRPGDHRSQSGRHYTA